MCITLNKIKVGKNREIKDEYKHVKHSFPGCVANLLNMLELTNYHNKTVSSFIISLTHDLWGISPLPSLVIFKADPI